MPPHASNTSSISTCNGELGEPQPACCRAIRWAPPSLFGRPRASSLSDPDSPRCPGAWLTCISPRGLTFIPRWTSARSVRRTGQPFRPGTRAPRKDGRDRALDLDAGGLLPFVAIGIPSRRSPPRDHSADVRSENGSSLPHEGGRASRRGRPPIRKRPGEGHTLTTTTVGIPVGERGCGPEARACAGSQSRCKSRPRSHLLVAQ